MAKPDYKSLAAEIFLSSEHGDTVRRLAAAIPAIANLGQMSEEEIAGAVGPAGQSLRTSMLAVSGLKGSAFMSAAEADEKSRKKAYNALVRLLADKAKGPEATTEVVAAGTKVRVIVDVDAAAGTTKASSPGAGDDDDTGAGNTAESTEGVGNAGDTPAYLHPTEVGAAVKAVAERVQSGERGSTLPKDLDTLSKRVAAELRKKFKPVSALLVAPVLVAFLKQNKDVPLYMDLYNLLPEAERVPPAAKPVATSKPEGSKSEGSAGGSKDTPSLVEALQQGLGGQGLVGGLDRPKANPNGGADRKPPRKVGAISKARQLLSGNDALPVIAKAIAGLYLTYSSRRDRATREEVVRDVFNLLDGDRGAAYNMPKDKFLRYENIWSLMPAAIRFGAKPQADGTPLLSPEAAAFYGTLFGVKFSEEQPQDPARATGTDRESISSGQDLWWAAGRATNSFGRCLLLARLINQHPYNNNRGPDDPANRAADEAVAAAISKEAPFDVTPQAVAELREADPIWLMLDRFGPGRWKRPHLVTMAAAGSSVSGNEPWTADTYADMMVLDLGLDLAPAEAPGGIKPESLREFAALVLKDPLRFAREELVPVDMATLGRVHNAATVLHQKGLLLFLQEALRSPKKGGRKPLYLEVQQRDEEATHPAQNLIDSYVSTNLPGLTEALSVKGDEEQAKQTLVGVITEVVNYISRSKTFIGVQDKKKTDQRKIDQPDAARAVPAPETPVPPKGAGEEGAKGGDGVGSKQDSEGTPVPVVNPVIDGDTDDKKGEGKAEDGTPKDESQGKRPADVPANDASPTPPTRPADTRETGDDGTILTLIRAAEWNGKRADRAKHCFKTANRRRRDLQSRLREAEKALADAKSALEKAQADAEAAKAEAKAVAERGAALVQRLTAEHQRALDAACDNANAEMLDRTAQAESDIAELKRQLSEAQRAADQAVAHANTTRGRARRIARRRRVPAILTGVIMGIFLLVMGIFLGTQVSRNATLRDTIAQQTSKITEVEGQVTALKGDLEAAKNDTTAIDGAMNPIKSALIILGLPTDGSNDELVARLRQAAETATSEASKAKGELVALRAANTALERQLAAASRPVAAPMMPAPSSTVPADGATLSALQAEINHLRDLLYGKQATAKNLGIPEARDAAAAIYSTIPESSRVAFGQSEGYDWLRQVDGYIKSDAHRSNIEGAFATFIARYASLFPNLRLEQSAGSEMLRSILYTIFLDQVRAHLRDLVRDYEIESIARK